jgi:hypothetical protein
VLAAASRLVRSATMRATTAAGSSGSSNSGRWQHHWRRQLLQQLLLARGNGGCRGRVRCTLLEEGSGLLRLQPAGGRLQPAAHVSSLGQAGSCASQLLLRVRNVRLLGGGADIASGRPRLDVAELVRR